MLARKCKSIVLYGILVVSFLISSTLYAEEGLLSNLITKDEYTIVAGGDVMLGRATLRNMTKNKKIVPEHPWEYVGETLRSADIAFVNLEGVASTRGTPLDKRYTFRFPPKTLEGLNWAGIDVVSLANNHALDYGYVALCDTVDNLYDQDIIPIGAGCDRADANAPYIKKLPDGTTVAFLAMSEFYQGNYATDTRPGFSIFSVDAMIKKTKELKKEGVNIVVVSVHAGTEHVFYPPERIRNMYKKLIDGGVDIVLGHHPHVPQPLVHYNNGYIAYSLGNLIFDMHDKIPHTTSQIMAKFTLKEGRVINAEKVHIVMGDDFRPELKAGDLESKN